ncbi:hypothetical protein BJ878DRAFT_541535 [Calycina marina]|uniref:Uncharacterized protein n=1 Tax=Calycina marina TaxID=1763456 RepID=A0A9P7Z4G8_9HELO|nr:hypothetical protein BJ878DRAFT_541535 [Calycina marina]
MVFLRQQSTQTLAPKKILVIVFMGNSDISDSLKQRFPGNEMSNFQRFYGWLVDAEFKALEKPDDVGSKKPLPNATMVAAYNQVLASTSTKFQNTHLGTKDVVSDTYSAL